MQGYHSGSLIIALMGCGKAVLGMVLRPLVGVFELGGKSAHGAGLLFLGREGISGTIQKRIRAPGTALDDHDEVGPALQRLHCGCSVKRPGTALSWCARHTHLLTPIHSPGTALEQL